MKAQKGNGCIDILLFNLAARCDSVVNTALLSLYRLERDPVITVHEDRWAPRPVWAVAENVSSTRIRSLEHPARGESLYQIRHMHPLWKLLHPLCSWSGCGPAWDHRTLNTISVTAGFCPLFQQTASLPQECRIHIGKLIVPTPQLVRKFSAFYKTRIPLLCSRQPATCPCHQPVEPNPHIFIFTSDTFHYFPHLYA